MKQFFIPPDFNLAAAWAADLAFPSMLKNLMNIDEIVVRPEDRSFLRALRSERLIVCSNHPTQAEPPVMWHVANVMGTRFRYMATRRAFDHWLGFMGLWFRGMGAYSVLPGVADR